MAAEATEVCVFCDEGDLAVEVDLDLATVAVPEPETATALVWAGTIALGDGSSAGETVFGWEVVETSEADAALTEA